MHITAPSVHFGVYSERSSGLLLDWLSGQSSNDLKNHSPHLPRNFRKLFAFSWFSGTISTYGKIPRIASFSLSSSFRANGAMSPMAYMTALTYRGLRTPACILLIADILSKPKAYFHMLVLIFHLFFCRIVFKIFKCNSPNGVSLLMRFSRAHLSGSKAKNAGSASALKAMASAQMTYPIVSTRLPPNAFRAFVASRERSRSVATLLVQSIPTVLNQSPKVNTASSTPISEYCSSTALHAARRLAHCTSALNVAFECGISAASMFITCLACTASPVGRRR
mmetsp:Transcript_4484/g.17175  ORF Transcript_4484/g.17175 Transcript_4484/m.17175 type:complete len:280 (-) Transcript_4484:1279-2118(-)